MDFEPSKRMGTTIIARAPIKRFANFLPILILLVLFWAVSLHNLTIVPRLYEDEAWQASTGWKLAQDGVFGSDVFAGWSGMERHYYGFMPLHPFLLALIYRVAGLGVFQTRFEPVALGMLTLALTYSLAQRVFQRAAIGWLAVLFLLLVRTTGTTVYQLTGILFLDLARLARYDMLVPVLALASVHAYLSARKKNRGAWYFLSGLLAGLAGLAHLYGVFMLPVLLLLMLIERRSVRPMARYSSAFIGAVAPFLIGFALPWLLYLAYVLSGIDDWRAQTQGYAIRFELLNPQWYFTNVLLEYHRYGPGLERSMFGVLERVGFWSAVVGIPLALGALAWRAWKGDARARIIVVPAIVLPILFALLLYLKLANYLVLIVPFFAIAAAWGVVSAWSHFPKGRGRWIRAGLVLLLAAMVLEGISRIGVLEAAAQTTTPYEQFERAVRQTIPQHSRVVGLHNYWLGLADFDYRSFLVPLAWADSHNLPRPLPFDQALTRLAPDIVLLDHRMREYFASTAEGETNRELLYLWLTQHNAQLVGHVDDATYGAMDIYRVIY